MSESEKPVCLKSYFRLCAVVFLVVVCTTSAMIATSFSHIGEGWTLKVALILAIAVVNAFLVAGYLMHLLSEKKLIYTVLGFHRVVFHRPDGPDALGHVRFSARHASH